MSSWRLPGRFWAPCGPKVAARRTPNGAWGLGVVFWDFVRSRAAGNQKTRKRTRKTQFFVLVECLFLYRFSCAVWLAGRGAYKRAKLPKTLKSIGFYKGIRMCAFFARRFKQQKNACENTRKRNRKNNENEDTNNTGLRP